MRAFLVSTTTTSLPQAFEVIKFTNGWLHDVKNHRVKIDQDPFGSVCTFTSERSDTVFDFHLLSDMIGKGFDMSA
jgi:hypothetical protein